MLRDTEIVDIPLDESNWGRPAKREQQHFEDFYRWTLIPGRPLELYRRPMTCFGRTWTLYTWARKLLTTPRQLHDNLVCGMRQGKSIRDVIMAMNPDMAQVLGDSTTEVWEAGLDRKTPAARCGEEKARQGPRPRADWGSAH